MRKAARPARLAHVTDAHTTVDGRPTTVLKHRSLEILTDILDQIRAWSPDCVLFGGDNIDNRADGERDVAAFSDLVKPLRRWRCVPGNHEASGPKPGRVTKAQFQRRFAKNGVPPSASGFSCAFGDVRIIGLDTTMLGSPRGWVPPDGLAYLAGELEASDEQHIVVLGHHLIAPCWRPYPLETWMDDYVLRNHEEVAGLLARHGRVRAYLCGHHHAHRITPVFSPHGPHGFFQVMTGSPVAYPHTARVLTFTANGLEVETVRARSPSVLEEGRQAVLLGRKASRFAELGASDDFLGYLEGTDTDNRVVLPYRPRRGEQLIAPRAASQ